MARAIAAKKDVDPEFPCSLIIQTPFPTHRLASSALRALQVDTELSPSVRRTFSLVKPPSSRRTSTTTTAPQTNGHTDPANSNYPTPNGTTATNGDSTPVVAAIISDDEAKTVLRTEYKAKTNRMLRVAVNGFMESLGVVLGVMERLDVDVLPKRGLGPAPPPATATASA